ncbi:hypothetical protein MYCTH_2065208 [Thermothelomyces thermophilus ATCC 42464]|uniref:Mid2 domain-containing protein n=1 Tax=Thermothelomyces thermophilus (strain ATCC 42464 / BCRC 31852 / DSM 1799) TaxID=573729 RepID=G2QGI8_THET4|nr:uncharacterized protein MYCTH_2065208 [Thermothelomyces thermophilus ATCC 42464]AEO59398.1 hypothetical protein MYCTH_2065208 [Thermothelomyces thermophilus ATCC 42464]
MPSFGFLLLLLPLLFVSGSADSDSCFFPNGKHAGSSASCWETTGNQTALCCQTGGLCLNNNVCAVKSRTGTSSYYRGSCIDSTWSNPKCPHFCEGPGRNDGIVLLHRCSGDETATKWFCGNEKSGPDNKDCASVDGDVEIPDGIYVYATAGNTPISLPAISSAKERPTRTGDTLDNKVTASLIPPPGTSRATGGPAPASSSPATTAPGVPPPVPSDAPEDEDDEFGSVIPIGVGVAVGTSILIAGSVIVFFYQRKRRRQAPVRAETPPPFEFSLIGRQAPGWLTPSPDARLREPHGAANMHGDVKGAPAAASAARYELP